MILGGRKPDGAPARAARGFSAVFLLLVFASGTVASGTGVHGCPRHHHHAPGPAAAGAPGGSGPAHATAEGGVEDGDAPGRDQRPAGDTCTCLGDCQAGVTSALHAPSARGVVDPRPEARIRILRSADLLAAPRSEYFLPYPLGPPAA